MTTSPRKFSEKIALHQQKQREGDDAFTQVMHELSNIHNRPSHQQLVPSPLRFHRGNSLPNVNQLGNQPLQMVNTHTYEGNSIKPFANISNVLPVPHPGGHFSIEDKHTSGRPGDRVHRTQRKAHMRHGTAPYNTPSFLQPPNDSSWRRTSSDSALHTSAMGGQAEHFQSAVPMQHKRGNEMVNSIEMVDAGRGLAVWGDAKKDEMVHNRPRSCEVPGIQICPSAEQQQDPSSSPIPISSNTGSLPDLTNLHIPSPLTTPIDNEDTLGYSNPSPGSMSPGGIHSPVSLASNHILTNTVIHSPQLSPHISPHMSPQNRRRDLPQLILAPDGRGLQYFQPTCMDLGMTMDQQQQMKNYQIYAQQPQQQQQSQQHSPHHQPNSPHSPYSPHSPHSPQNIQGDINLEMAKVGLQQYRDNKMPSHTCSSPTSPAANSDYSPVASPGAPVGSPQSPGGAAQMPFVNNNGGGNFYHQQAQNLPHQFEQISMLQDTVVTPEGSPTNTNQQLVYPQNFYTTQSDLEFLQQVRGPPPYTTGTGFLHNPNPGSMSVPDIVFTGPDFGPTSNPDFARDLGSAIGVDSGGMDTILLSDTLGLDPSDFDILSDNDPVADQAAEDSFRSDHL